LTSRAISRPLARSRIAVRNSGWMASTRRSGVRPRPRSLNGVRRSS
jgi:hypothetical protein